MNREHLAQFIGQVFPLQREQADEITAHFSEAYYAKNDLLLKEGKVCRDYIILQDGYMRAFTSDPDGGEVTTAFYCANQVVFECASFFLHTPSRENIQALTDCNGWYITFDQLQYLFHALPGFREFGRTVLVNSLVSLKQRMLSMINETAEQRYEHLLAERPEIIQNAPLKYVASYLGITDTSLSRIRREISGR